MTGCPVRAMSIYVDLDLEPIEAYARSLGRLAEKQFPFAAARALNDAGKKAIKEDLPKEMRRVFDEPTKFTQNGFFTSRATKQDLRIEIRPREFAGKGTAAFKYLEPEIEGGGRVQKRSEKRLSALVGRKVYLLPGKAAKLNKHGNLTGSQMVKILSRVGALSDQSLGKRGRRKITAAKKLVNHGSRAKSDHFIARSRKSGQPFAIYRYRKKGVVEPVLYLTTRQPRYKAIFQFAPVLDRAVAEHLPTFFQQRLDEAILTARI